MATTTTLRRWGVIVAAVLFVPSAFVTACSSSDSNPQPTPIYNLGDSSVSPGLDSAAPTTDSALPPDEDAPVTQLDGAPVLDAATCVGDGGCWSCSPASSSEFLNQCTASQCSPFANATRLPNYDGGLPPLN